MREAKLKGSELDRSMSFAKLDKQLEQNGLQAQQEKLASIVTTPRASIDRNAGPHQKQGVEGHSLLNTLLRQEQPADEQVPWELRTTKRKRRKGQRL